MSIGAATLPGIGDEVKTPDDFWRGVWDEGPAEATNPGPQFGDVAEVPGVDVDWLEQPPLMFEDS